MLRSTRLIVGTVIMLFVYMSSVSAQYEDYQMGLNELVEHARFSSTSVIQAGLDREKADHMVAEVRSSALPQINAEGQLQYFPNLPTQLLPGEIVGMPGTQIPVQFGTEYTMSGTIRATQVLYNQELMTGLMAARSTRELYDLLKVQSEEEAIYETAVAYYQALSIKSQIEVLEHNLVTLEELEGILEVQYENDLVLKTDFSRVQLSRSSLSTQLTSLKNLYDQQVNYIKLLSGLPLESELKLKVDQDVEDLQFTPYQLNAENLIEINLLNKQTALQELNKKSIAAGYAPSLALFGQQGWQAQRNEFNFTDSGQPWFQQTVIGLQLQVPIFDGLKKHHQIQQNKIELEQLNNQKSFVQEQLRMQYQNASETLLNTYQVVQDQKRNKELALEVYDQSKDLYKEQLASLTDLLDSERVYREAQRSYYNEVINFRIAELKLLKSAGYINTISNK